MGTEHGAGRRTARRAAARPRPAADRAAHAGARRGDGAGARHARRRSGRGCASEAGPGGAAPDASTVYRNLELLERLGLVWHTHLGKGAPVYHAAEHPHLHVVCQSCGEIASVAPDLLDERRGTSGGRSGFHRRRGSRGAVRDVPRLPRTSRIGARMNVSPLLSRPGAVAVEDGAVAAHYGDPLREQRLLAEGAGLVDRSDRDVVAVPGADRLTWLHSLTSQHLERLADASGSEALVLSPERARRAPPRARRPGRHHVGRRRARRRRGAGRVPAEDAVHAPRRPGAGHRRLGGAVARGAARRTTSWPPRGCRRRSVRRRARSTAAASSAGCPPIGDGGADGVRPRSSRAPTRGRRGPAGRAARPGLAAYEALRVEARRPRFGVDSDHRTIPNELSWLQHRRPPGQGLLPRPGDRRPGAQPGPAAAAAGPAAPGRRQRGARRARRRRCSPAPARSAGSARWCATTSSA